MGVREAARWNERDGRKGYLINLIRWSSCLVASGFACDRHAGVFSLLITRCVICGSGRCGIPVTKYSETELIVYDSRFENIAK